MHMQTLWKPQGCLSALTAWLLMKVPMLFSAGQLLFDMYLWAACVLRSRY